MTQKEIEKIAISVTYSHQTTTIVFKDKPPVHGYFENNTNPKLINDNIWKFKVFLIDEIQTYDGSDIVSITVSNKNLAD
jgi:hypothetical protein